MDVAVLAIPQPAVLDAVRASARRKTGAAASFCRFCRGRGPRGGPARRYTARIAQAAGMVIEGPNCLGSINYLDRVPLTFVDTDISAEQAAFNRSAEHRPPFCKAAR